MKRIKNLKALIAIFILGFPSMLMAQKEGGTYIDNLDVQDSSYLNEDLLVGYEKSSNSTVIIIVAAVVVIAVVAFVIIKKKKKK